MLARKTDTLKVFRNYGITDTITSTTKPVVLKTSAVTKLQLGKFRISTIIYKEEDPTVFKVLKVLESRSK
jgi:hydroxylamine reductase (hybrid-cluster protein)